MSHPSAPDPDAPHGGAPQGQPGWGAPPPSGYGQPGHGQPSYGQAPGYGQYPGYPSAPTYGSSGYVASMGMPEAVRSVLSQYATFSGRARRSEFWWFYLASVLLSVVAAVVDASLGTVVVGWVVSLGLLVPSLAVGARRLHDIDRTGWWQLIALVPLVGIIVLIVFFAQDGQPNPNRYGPSPKYQLVGG